MTRLARVFALVGGLACLVLTAAWALREVAAELRPDLDWSAPAWWHDVMDRVAWPTTLSAAVMGLVAAVFLALAVRELRGRRRGYAVEFGEKGASVQLDVRALQRAMGRRVAEGVPGVVPDAVQLTMDAGGWVVRLEASFAAHDLLGAQAAARELLADDLRRLGGIELVALDVVVTGLAPAAGEPQPPAR